MFQLRPVRFAPILLPLLVAAGCTVLAGCTVGEGEFMFPDAGPVDAAFDAGPAPDAGPPPPALPCEAGSTLGQSCTLDVECDDRCFCNGRERCVDGACAAGTPPCVDGHECTDDVCVEEVSRCFFQPRHERCEGGDGCTSPICDPRMGCRDGSPRFCNDENPCTLDSCDPEVGCVFSPRDLDGDGYVDSRCGGDDCDDDPRFGFFVNPGMTEDCFNGIDDDCDGLRDFFDPDCVPDNGTCDRVRLLEGPGRYIGSTDSLAADYTLACRANGPDAVFAFELTEVRDVEVLLFGGGSNAAIALRPLSLCEDGPDDRCVTDLSPRLSRRALAPGEYALIVKTATPAAFELDLRITDPSEVPPYDACDEASPDISEGGVFVGAFADVADIYSLSCRSGARPEGAYRLVITEETGPQDVRIQATTIDATGTTHTSYLVLTTNCVSRDAELRCVSGNPGELRQRELPPGVYYVLVESFSTEAIGWRLDVDVTDPLPREPGDACSTALSLNEGSAVVDMATLELDSGTACGGTGFAFRDANFYFEIEELRDVTLETHADGALHYAALQTECGVSATDLRCWSGSSTQTQVWRSLGPGTYFLTVATSRSTGPMTINFITGPPTPIPPNDSCDQAIELLNGTSRLDTTVGFANELNGCVGTTLPDAFYRISLDERRRVIVSVSNASSGSPTFYLTLRPDCTDPLALADRICTSGSGVATLNTVLDAGEYILMVENFAGSVTDFNISAAFFAP